MIPTPNMYINRQLTIHIKDIPLQVSRQQHPNKALQIPNTITVIKIGLEDKTLPKISNPAMLLLLLLQQILRHRVIPSTRTPLAITTPARTTLATRLQTSTLRAEEVRLITTPTRMRTTTIITAIMDLDTMVTMAI